MAVGQAYDHIALVSSFITMPPRDYWILIRTTPNGHKDILILQPLDCLFSSLRRLTSKKTLNIRTNGPLRRQSTGDRLSPFTKGASYPESFHLFGVITLKYCESTNHMTSPITIIITRTNTKLMHIYIGCTVSMFPRIQSEMIMKITVLFEKLESEFTCKYQSLRMKQPSARPDILNNVPRLAPSGEHMLSLSRDQTFRETAWVF